MVVNISDWRIHWWFCFNHCENRVLENNRQWKVYLTLWSVIWWGKAKYLKKPVLDYLVFRKWHHKRKHQYQWNCQWAESSLMRSHWHWSFGFSHGTERIRPILIVDENENEKVVESQPASSYRKGYWMLDSTFSEADRRERKEGVPFRSTEWSPKIYYIKFSRFRRSQNVSKI